MKRNLRVLHVGPHIGARGGIASVLSCLSEHASLFADLGVDFNFLPTTLNRPSKSYLKLLTFIKAFCQLVWVLLRSKTDIVQIHTAIRGSLIRKSVFAAGCVIFRTKYILHIHNGGFVQNYLAQSVIVKYCIRLLLRHAASVIVLSQHSRDAMIRLEMVTSEHCKVVFNGIADPLHGEMPCRNNDGSSINVTFLGLLCADKGVPSLISAVGSMASDLPKFCLRLGGIGDVTALQEAILINKVSETVEYVGWLDSEKKANLLSRTDIFVLPSRSEGFSVAIVEAMAYGAAILSTTIPGVIDVVRDGIDGLLTKPDDVHAIAAALERLIINSQERAHFGDSARQRFLDNFTIDRMATQLLAAYKAVRSHGKASSAGGTAL